VLVSDEELIAIFGIIGSLPRIRELRIEFDELPLPAQALRNALACPTSKLRYLALEDVRLSGSIRDFQDVAEAVRKSTSLRTFRMYRCGPAHDTRATLDPIIAALSDVPTLKDITLSSTHLSDRALGTLGRSHSLECVSLDHMSISGLPLGELCRSQSIKELKFWGMPEINDDVSYLTFALNNNPCLKMLRLRYCHLNEESGVKISQMISENTVLESLSLENIDWKSFGGPFQQAFERNNTLKSLSMSIDVKGLNMEDNAVKLAAGLENNTSLRKLRLMFRDIDADAIRQAYLGPVSKLLQKNYTLESLYLNSSALILSEEIDFLLKLNRTGKRHLLRDDTATKADFMDMLAANSEDVSITHYVLTMNPALFSA
jgi:hypothetical protein